MYQMEKEVNSSCTKLGSAGCNFCCHYTVLLCLEADSQIRKKMLHGPSLTGLNLYGII